MRHGGKVLADQLSILGVKRVFSVPGESFLAALDGLYDSGIENIVCRHEGGAAMMAEAYGKLTGTPGVAFVTRGPGATNASAGVHVARQDSTPMVLFVGQIARDHRDRDVFQEVDYRAMFGPLAKWVAEIDQTDRLPEYIARAFHIAQTGRPGPVVLALPEDMLSATCDVADMRPPAQIASPAVDAQVAANWLAEATNPLVVVGGPHWSADAEDALARFADAHQIPVAADFRRQDYLRNDHPCYAGDLNVAMNPALAQRLANADRLLVLGSRLGDIETKGFTLADPTRQQQRIFHVHADIAELGRLWQPDHAVCMRADEFVKALAAVPPVKTFEKKASDAKQAYKKWVTPIETPGAVKQEGVIKWLSDNLPKDAIVTNGAGNYAAFLHRYFSYKQYGTQLAPTSGSMGYGFPAAVSASLEHPDKTVVCLAGDGCIQMTLNEMSTAIQHGAKPIVIVMNNGQYGTIRMHQERSYKERVSGTALANPDYAALARAYGGHGETVETQADFAPAFERARASGTLAVIECRIDPEALSTGQTLTQVRGG
ncbi:thiamine pyrophosphate-binding protein [Marivivens donghaensis]|uniref:Thiamine pyrophosphate-binding protein n=1 Tax=Marivivens donghaensis TaxID=1699413 RepID=A0ABX0VYF9_9RHOB|nr:thiamine pyrophosphate-binding protein [Marivivens donghaensis]NIY71683.1 thiamine pyrophosphate-binding protein [Marivivens donghaensis]